LMMLLLIVVINCCCFQFTWLIHISIYYFWFVNSPLLLELPPRGQVQVTKA